MSYTISMSSTNEYMYSELRQSIHGGQYEPQERYRLWYQPARI